MHADSVRLIGMLIVFALQLLPLRTQATPVPAPAQQNKIQWKQLPEDPAKWRREPFRKTETPQKMPIAPNPFVGGKQPAVTPARKTTTAKLQGIMNSEDRYYAVINGRTVKAGDSIGGLTVQEISRYQVTILDGTERYVLDIYQGRIDRGMK